MPALPMRLPSAIDHPVLHIFLSPLERVQEEVLTTSGRIAAGLGAVGAWIVGDIFTGIVVLMFLSAVADTIWGRAVARLLDEYNDLKASVGLQSKFMGIVIACLIRGFEYWVHYIDLPNVFHTHGAVASAIAATLFLQDLKSIQEKRERFGQGPIPILGWALARGETFVRRLVGVSHAELKEFKRRADDDPGSQGV